MEIPGKLSLSGLPPELITYIASLACTDGGRTGSSLSAVSRYIADAAKSYRYQSVALSGRHQMKNFYHTIIRVPMERRRVRDLYLFDQRSNWASVMDRDPLTERLQTLLPLLAAQLDTLTCVVFGAVKTDLLFPLLICRFPSLTSLTLRLTIPELSSLSPGAIHARMPRLKRLTYAIANDIEDSPALLGALLSSCPSLAHLDLADVFLSFLGPVPAAAIAKRIGAPLDAGGLGTGVRVRVEATLKQFGPLRDASEEDKRQYTQAIGYAAYRAAERTEQEWKHEWVARPHRVF